MKTLNPNLSPKSGYHFVERDGSRIFADTWAGVVARVVAYRRRANYPIGPKVHQEVIDQACQREPGLCVETTGIEGTQIRVASLKSRVLRWLTDIRARVSDLKFIPGAEQRAEICARCPNNTELPGGCATCAAAVSEFRKAIIGGRQQDGRIHACSVLGEDLPTAVHIEQQTIENNTLPAHCWRKRTL